MDNGLNSTLLYGTILLIFLEICTSICLYYFCVSTKSKEYIAFQNYFIQRDILLGELDKPVEPELQMLMQAQSIDELSFISVEIVDHSDNEYDRVHNLDCSSGICHKTSPNSSSELLNSIDHFKGIRYNKSSLGDRKYNSNFGSPMYSYNTTPIPKYITYPTRIPINNQTPLHLNECIAVEGKPSKNIKLRGLNKNLNSLKKCKPLKYLSNSKIASSLIRVFKKKYTTKEKKDLV